MYLHYFSSGLSKPESVVSIVEDLDEMIYASVDVQGGIQPTRAQLLETQETTSQQTTTAAAQAHSHTVDIKDEDDFMFYPDFFEFD